MINNDIVLKPIKDDDYLMLKTWLEKPYILKWYHDADEWLNEISARDKEFSFISHKIVYVNEKPIGFCQYYDCFSAKEEWYEINKDNTMFSIDYLIGEEEFLGKGFGTKIVNELVKEINLKYNNPFIIAKPEKENIASQKTLLSAGFTYDQNNEYYYKRG